MSEKEKISLKADKLRLELSPSVGGSISAFEWIDGARSRSILRQSSIPLDTSLAASCFPLVPFVNRIRGGEFHFRGHTVRLAPNMAGDPSPLHGQGWQCCWIVTEVNDRHAILDFHHPAGEWPWTYEARQEFILDDAGFTVTLSCRNRGPGPMPCGLGEHPYFPCGPETRIDTGVTDVWTIDSDVLPVARISAKGRYSLNNRQVCGQNLDNGFAGWNGEARISDPDWPYEVRLASPDAHFFQLYSPPTGGIFVAEPVTHANSALNARESEWRDLGIRILNEKETMSLSMRLEIVPR